ncbi:MAG: universal stress protein [Blastochloris sp.]|nr:universal stress protein [Blastochloris sp.]
MKRILVATDFSTRSDRALRRATLLARQVSAEIVLVHVVDDDQPPRLLRVEEREAGDLLEEIARSVREIDHIRCETRLVLGDPFQAIANAAEGTDADLIVMGPHRRQALRDVFIGTTVERTIRQSRRPVIMANAVPAGSYSRVLVATDFSDCSAAAVREAGRRGFLDHAEVIALHAFDAPAQSLMIRASMTTAELKQYLADEEERAAGELSEFLHKVDLRPSRRCVQLNELSTPETIRTFARSHKVNLVVLGTHGRSGVAKLLLGSVAEEVLRNSEVDVLVVPAAADVAAADVAADPVSG